MVGVVTDTLFLSYTIAILRKSLLCSLYLLTRNIVYLEFIEAKRKNSNEKTICLPSSHL